MPRAVIEEEEKKSPSFGRERRPKRSLFLWRIWELDITFECFVEQKKKKITVHMVRVLNIKKEKEREHPNTTARRRPLWKETLPTNGVVSRKRRQREKDPTRADVRARVRAFTARGIHRARLRNDEKKLSSALSRRQTQTGHLAIRGAGETAKREQVFPGLARNRG